MHINRLCIGISLLILWLVLRAHHVVQRRGKRPYLGSSCGRWVWTDRARKQVCHCCLPFNREDPKPGGQFTEQQQRLQRERDQKNVEGSKLAALEAVLAKVVASMPQVEREQFEKDFPILRPKPKKEEPDPFKKVSAEAAKAFREFKRLGDRRHNIELRASRLQQQQGALSEELATTIADLEAAQYKHECISRSYAAVVQKGVEEGPQPDDSFEYHPAWDRDSDISGMGEDQGTIGAEGGLREGGGSPQRLVRFAQGQRATAQRAAASAVAAATTTAAAAAAAGQQQPSFAWPAHWDLQDPTFRSFFGIPHSRAASFSRVFLVACSSSTAASGSSSRSNRGSSEGSISSRAAAAAAAAGSSRGGGNCDRSSCLAPTGFPDREGCCRVAEERVRGPHSGRVLVYTTLALPSGGLKLLAS